MTGQANEPVVVGLTREEVGLAIDGVAALVQDPLSSYRPLLRKLQDAYAPLAPPARPVVSPPDSPEASLHDLAGTAVMATLPLLPLTGSWNHGYRVNDRIHTTLVATAEEWADAAQAIAELHAALAASPPSPQLAETRYDFEKNEWHPRCPYGDVCTGCDADGKCSRALASVAVGQPENTEPGT